MVHREVVYSREAGTAPLMPPGARGDCSHDARRQCGQKRLVEQERADAGHSFWNIFVESLGFSIGLWLDRGHPSSKKALRR